MDIFLFKIALTAYFLSTLGYTASILIRRVLIAKTSTWVLFAAFAIHSGYIVFRLITTGHSPVVNLHESLSFIAWAISGSYLAFQMKTKTRILGAIVSPLALVLMIETSAFGGLAEGAALPSVLKGWWVSLHTVLALSGEALFALACCAGIMYLIQDNLIRRKKAYSFSRLLPPLRDLDRINHISILWGFPLLTLGIIAGAIWAHTVWGRHWQWDPKQVWTMITWFLYAFLLHQRLAFGWKGRKAAVFSIVAFGILLFAVIGVHIFFVTVHDFV
jgi:cytochrome c-type biogenesis protein CcsB